MTPEKTISITVGASRDATVWSREETTWGRFADRLRSPARTDETYQDYINLTKARQQQLKDVGGFVGGTFKGTRRKKNDALTRDLITLDLDTIPALKTAEILNLIESSGLAAVVYSTRKHCDRTPRLRVIFPFENSAEPDEYEPAARKLCDDLKLMPYADPTTFEVNRLMYWPSCSTDSEYVFRMLDGAPVSCKSLLEEYEDWKDITSWPQVPGIDAVHRRNVARAEDPLRKKGIVGAFCRTYTVPEAMDKFLQGLYEETKDTNRRTYTGGSTYGGAVIYDDKFLYSHHATDPCGGRLSNAFDMVRIQKYAADGTDDTAAEGTPVGRLPSYQAMSELAKEDAAVQKQMAEDRKEAVKEAFLQDAAADGRPKAARETEDGDAAELDLDWVEQLDADKKGHFMVTIRNFRSIIEHDPVLCGRLTYEKFSGRLLVQRPFLWDKKGQAYPRIYREVDDSYIREHIEDRYKIYSKDKCLAAIDAAAEQNGYDAVVRYLDPLRWDGVPRLDRLLVDYLGANDTPYTHAVARKTLTAAVARAYCKGHPVKFDYMPILSGPQGIGKSTLLRTLAFRSEWFNDSMTTFEGRDAQDVIQGSWIVEVGELTAMSKQENNAVKQFLSKTADRYRKAYDRRTEDHVRRCIFVGTTNDFAFLRDQTGNRRFWPVECRGNGEKSVFEDLPGEVNQIWAEAKMRYAAGEARFMETKDLEEAALRQQEEHRMSSGMEGEIELFLEEPIPENWYELDKTQRKIWRSDPKNLARTDLPKRQKVCAAEVWEEYYGRSYAAIPYTTKMELNQAMRSLKGWKEVSGLRLGTYGRQRGFRRCS